MGPTRPRNFGILSNTEAMETEATNKEMFCYINVLPTSDKLKQITLNFSKILEKYLPSNSFFVLKNTYGSKQLCIVN